MKKVLRCEISLYKTLLYYANAKKVLREFFWVFGLCEKRKNQLFTNGYDKNKIEQCFGL